MKSTTRLTLLLLLLALGPLSAVAQPSPIRRATPTETADGTNNSAYVTPYALSQSGVLDGAGGAATNVSNGSYTNVTLTETTVRSGTNGVATIRRSNGTFVSFFAVSSSAVDRGVALVQAKNAAVAGDKIFVFAGGYVTNSLVKDGVDWDFGPVTVTAAALNAPSNGVHSVWSEDSGGSSFSVSGHGTFITTNGWAAKLLGTNGVIVLRGRSFRAVHGTTPGTQAILENGYNSVTLEATESLISEGYDGLIKTGTGKVWIRAPYAYSADNPVEITDGGLVTLDVTHWVSAAGLNLDSSELNLNFGTLEITNNGVGAAGGLFAATASDRGSVRAERLIVRDPADTTFYGTNSWSGNLMPADTNVVRGSLRVNGTVIGNGGGLTNIGSGVGVTLVAPGISLAAGNTGYAIAKRSGTIKGWTIHAPATGSIVIDVWQTAFSTSTWPDNSDSITDGNEPTLSAAVAAVDTDVSNWSTRSVTAGDMFVFNVDSATTCTNVSIDLNFE